MRAAWLVPLIVCCGCTKPKEQPAPSSPPSPAVSAPAPAPAARPASRPAASQPTRIIVNKNPWREVTLPAKAHKVKLVPRKRRPGSRPGDYWTPEERRRLFRKEGRNKQYPRPPNR
jgi:hypothetical protein